MTMSPLYRRLGLTGPLLNVEAGVTSLGDQVYSIDIHRGSDSLSSYQPGTVTVETPRTVTSNQGQALNVYLTEDAAARISDLTGGEVPANEVLWRFTGRNGARTVQDRGNGRGTLGRLETAGTTITGAAWPSMLDAHRRTYTPVEGDSLRTVALDLLAPDWEPRVSPVWRWASAEPSDTWGPGPHDPITASDLLGILQDRLYAITDDRLGYLRISTLSRLEERIGEPASPYRSRPLARSQCLAPIDWEVSSGYPTRYRVTITNPDLTTTQHAADVTMLPHRLEDLDWTTFVSRTDQWRRIHGLAWDTERGSWRLPSITVRIDLLLASPREYDRRVAGYLLTLNPGDPVALAGDWPDRIYGVHLTTSLDERITAHEWTLSIGLTPSGSVAGNNDLDVKPFIWDQMTSPWDDHALPWNAYPATL